MFKTITFKIYIYIFMFIFQLSGFQQGILKLAMEPSVLGSAFTEGGPDRKIKLDRNPGIDEVIICMCVCCKYHAVLFTSNIKYILLGI